MSPAKVVGRLGLLPDYSYLRAMLQRARAYLLVFLHFFVLKLLSLVPPRIARKENSCGVPWEPAFYARRTGVRVRGKVAV